jgi:hypothetical protein
VEQLRLHGEERIEMIGIAGSSLMDLHNNLSLQENITTEDLYNTKHHSTNWLFLFVSMGKQAFPRSSGTSIQGIDGVRVD